MRIFFISYGLNEYDGRQRELIKVAKKIADTTCLVCSNFDTTEFNDTIVLKQKSFFSYIKFIWTAIKHAKKHRYDVIFAHNRRATIPALLIKKRNPKIKIIQDATELYIKDETKSLTGKIGCVFEESLYHKADVVICANSFRAEKMMGIYNLDKIPLVFQNLRRLEYSNGNRPDGATVKFKELLKENTFNLISTSGCSIDRTNDILVKEMRKIDFPCKLFLVGNSSEKDKSEIEKIIKQYDLKNVFILGQLNQDELKYLISKSHVGIVNYGEYDFNNKYCASGKIFEFIFEGKPVIATNNPPLKQLCREYSFGISSSSYSEAIIDMFNNYDVYAFNAKKAASNISIDENNITLAKEIKDILK